MTKYKVTYNQIMSDHALATPEPVSSEIVEAEGWEDLVAYIENQQDLTPSYYKRKEVMGFQFVSNMGAVTVEVYEEPKIKQIPKAKNKI